MAGLILAVIASLIAVSASSTPVSVRYGDDASFSWPLSASAQGKLVAVVNPKGIDVLNWAPDCTVTPSPYYAHRVGASCKDASHLTFTLQRVSWQDEGLYTCREPSGVQIADCGQNLTIVTVSPQVHIELSTPDTATMENEPKNLTLTCVVTQALPPVPEDGYSWSYLSSPQGQLRPLVGKTRTLTLGSLTREDGGQYFCQARNDEENRGKSPPGKASVALNASCIDALLHSDVSSKAVMEKDKGGYKALFELALRPGLLLVQHPNTFTIAVWNPPCNLSVPEAFKQRVTNTSYDPCKRTLSFSLSSLTERDLGRYQCFAGTTQGARIDSCSVELVSDVPTQVHIEPRTPDNVVKGAEGNNMTLTCVVTQAFPPVPEDGYSWSHLPSPDGLVRHLPGDARTLTLDPLTRVDRGQYFCQARNDQIKRRKLPPGIASVIVDVSYLGQIKSTSEFKVNKGDHVTLTCSVDSKPAARLAWVVEGQEICNVTGREVHYVVERAACSDSKTYKCRASNPDLPSLERDTSTTLTVNCGQAQASEGLEWWQITLFVGMVSLGITLTIGVGMRLYTRKRPPSMSQKSQSKATAEQTAKAEVTVATLENERTTAQKGDQTRKRPPSMSQKSQSKATAEQTAKAEVTAATLENERTTAQKGDQSFSEERISGGGLSAGNLRQSVETQTMLSDLEITNSQRSAAEAPLLQSEESTRGTSPRADKSADTTPDEAEREPMLEDSAAMETLV